MKKTEDRLNIAKIVLILNFFLLSIIVLYFKFVSNKQTYATEVLNVEQKQLVEISNANQINIENIIEKNNQNTSREEIYEKQEELEYITKYKNSNELYVGTTRISQQGRNGIQTITMKKTHNLDFISIKFRKI